MCKPIFCVDCRFYSKDEGTSIDEQVCTHETSTSYNYVTGTRILKSPYVARSKSDNSNNCGYSAVYFEPKPIRFATLKNFFDSLWKK